MYKFRKKHRDQEVADIQREIEDNLISLDKDGNVVINKDIYCRDLITQAESVYIGSKKPENRLKTIKQELYFNDIQITSLGSASGIVPHAARHESGGADEIDFNIIAGALPDVSSKTADYTAVFNDFLLCDGTFKVTMPDITASDLGKKVTVCNIGTGIITVEGNGDDTIYGETDMECIAGGTFVLMATTILTWVLV